MNLNAILPSIIISEADLKAASIKNGEVCRISIRNAGHDGSVKLLLKGIPIEAKSEIPLEAGDVLNVRAAVADKRIILRLIPSEEAGKISDIIRRLVSEKTDIGKLLNELKTALPLKISNDKEGMPSLKTFRNFLESLFIDSKTATGEAVKNIIEKGGQFYEAFLKNAVGSGASRIELLKLAASDLKPVIMNLIQELSGNPRHKETLKTAAAVLKNIELSQLINETSSKNNAPLHLYIPVYFGDNHETLELYFFEDKKAKNRGKRDYGIILNISLEGLGNITFDIRTRKNSVFINIYTESRETSLLLNSHLNILENSLKSQGLHIAGIECMDIKNQTGERHYTGILSAGLLSEFA